MTVLGLLDITLFADALERFGDKLQKDTVVIVSGTVSFDDFSQGLKMSVRELMTLDEARSRYVKFSHQLIPRANNTALYSPTQRNY